MIDSQRLQAAYATARADLLAECDSSGCWAGRLASSPSATATSLSALTLLRQQARTVAVRTPLAEMQGEESDVDSRLSAALGISQQQLDQLILHGLHWLVTTQNADGGWGDTDQSGSKLAATMLVRAAFQLNGVPGGDPSVLERADAYIALRGGPRGLKKRHMADKSFYGPILANWALAGLIPWREVPTWRTGLALLPPRLRRTLHLSTEGYGLPALLAVSQVRNHYRRVWNPLGVLVRRATGKRCLEQLAEMQPASGGYLEAVPVTGFVVMCLAGMGEVDHPVALSGARFLLQLARGDGSWPIMSNLSSRVTTLGVLALLSDAGDTDQGDPEGSLSSDNSGETAPDTELDEPLRRQWLDRLCAAQHRHIHPAAGAAPGGWSWTDSGGGLPDTEDTATALLALGSLAGILPRPSDRNRWQTTSSFGSHDSERAAASVQVEPRLMAAAINGIDWLLDLQNDDGGWPTFGRGRGETPFDRSGADLTALALRALDLWYRTLDPMPSGSHREHEARSARILTAIGRGFAHLEAKQEENGSWLPLWYGNEQFPREENPTLGTARVLLAYRDLERLDAPAARRGFDWLLSAQDISGGWGVWCRLKPATTRAAYDAGHAKPKPAAQLPAPAPSIEESSLALEALLSDPRLADEQAAGAKVEKGLAWLLDAVEQDRHLEASPIGLCFARLWYHEKLYPMVMCVSALAAAKTKLDTKRSTRPTPLHSVT